MMDAASNQRGRGGVAGVGARGGRDVGGSGLRRDPPTPWGTPHDDPLGRDAALLAWRRHRLEGYGSDHHFALGGENEGGE